MSRALRTTPFRTSARGNFTYLHAISLLKVVILVQSVCAPAPGRRTRRAGPRGVISLPRQASRAYVQGIQFVSIELNNYLSKVMLCRGS